MEVRGAHGIIDIHEAWGIIENALTKFTQTLDEGVPVYLDDFFEDIICALPQRQISIRGGYAANEDQLYDRYRRFLNEYINTRVLPCIGEKRDEFLLEEFYKHWNNHKSIVRLLSLFSNHFDEDSGRRISDTVADYMEHFYGFGSCPPVKKLGIIRFREQLYTEIKNNVIDAVLGMIDREREGEQIDRELVTHAIGIFRQMDVYKIDLESPLLEATAAYYSRKEDSCAEYMRKVDGCLKREEERVEHYLLDLSTKDKLIDVVERAQQELLSQHRQEMLEQCHALLRDDKVDDLSRMYRLFCRIPDGLEPIAAIFRMQATEEGTALFKEAEDSARNKKTFFGKVIHLYGKYLQYVKECFENHPLFCEALKETFEVFCNKRVGSTSAELLATFCDKLLKKGGYIRYEKLTDEAIEDTLEKVVGLLAYTNDKDLFAEFYSKKLALRLLFDKSANDKHERSILTKLKQQCGEEFTSKMEGMVTDLTLARENQGSFEKYLASNAESSLGIDLTVTVLRTFFWPSYKSLDLALPSEMEKCAKIFEEFYQTQTDYRKVTSNQSLGTCNIIGKFEPKQIELVVSSCQAAVLLLFNTSEKLSYSDIRGQLNLTDEDAIRLLHSLSCAKHKILLKEPDTKTVGRNDVFEFNAKFTVKTSQIKMPLLPLDEQKIAH